MRILLINHYAGSPRHGMEYRPWYLAREWLRQGHAVRVVAASRSHVRSVQPELRGASLLEHVDRGRVPLAAHAGIQRQRTAQGDQHRGLLPAACPAGGAAGARFRPDVVVASSTYPMDIWPAGRVARAAGAKLVHEVHDL
ncbi:MAG: glycosyltransferase [Ideonella sp.]|nr:glycosyltransferase [Ideonella sp.]